MNFSHDDYASTALQLLTHDETARAVVAHCHQYGERLKLIGMVDMKSQPTADWFEMISETVDGGLVCRYLMVKTMGGDVLVEYDTRKEED